MNATMKRLLPHLIATLAIAAPPSIAHAETAAEWARKGVAEYENGKLDEAVKSFQKAAELDPDDSKIQYNLGTALSKQGSHAEAIKALERSLASQNLNASGSPRFNLGYTRVTDANKRQDADPEEKMKALRDGLADFKQAILENPADRDAKFNYEATKLLLKQLQQQMQHQSQGGKSDKKDNKGQKGQEGDKQDGNQQGDQKNEEDSEKSQGQDGKDGQSKEQGGSEQNKSDGEGKQEEGEQEGEKKKDEKSDHEKDGQSDEGQTQEKGLESTPTPKPQEGKDGNESKQGNGKQPDPKLTPKPEKSQPQKPQQGAPGGEAQGEQKPEPLTKEQLDALRVLNSLEQEKPEQFKKLFRFQGKGSSKRPERPW